MSTPQQEDVGISLLKAVGGGEKSDVEKLFEENAAAVEYVNYQDQNLLSPLLLASCLGHTEIVEFLLKNGALVDMLGIDGMTALSAASESGHHGIVQKLAEAGAKIDHISHHLFTPLMLASRHGHTETVKVLLKLKANVNLTTEYNMCTALMFASKGGHAEVVELLLHHVMKVNSDRDGLTPLMFASANGHAGVARLLLENNKSQVNQRCSNGYTSLLLASYYGHDKVAEVLIEYGANVDMRTKKGTTALIEACVCGHVQFVKVLLDHNAEVNPSLYSFYGYFQMGATALMIACQSNSLEIVKLLLREDNRESCNLTDDLVEMSEEESVVQETSPQADVNLQDCYGRTALSYACEKGDVKIVQALVNHGADVNPTSTSCMSPLLYAVRRENVDIVRVLLENGAGPNPSEDSRSDYYNTPPLIVATLSENVDIVQLLLSHKANVDVTATLNGEIQVTPLMLAILAGCHKLVEIFVQNGVKILNHFRRKQDDGHHTTLVDLAKACGDTKIIRLIQSNTVGNDTSDNEEPQAKKPRLNYSEDNVLKDLWSSIERNFQTLDSHCPRRRDCRVSELFQSDNYTSLLEKNGPDHTHPCTRTFESKRPTSQSSSTRLVTNVGGKPVPLTVGGAYIKMLPVTSKWKSVPPTIKDAYAVLLPVASKWKSIGVLLKIDYSKLQTIKTDKKDSQNALLEMVVEWLKRIDSPQPTWSELVEAVKPFDPTIARRVSDNYCNMSQLENTPTRSFTYQHIPPLSVKEAYNILRPDISSQWMVLGMQLNIDPWKLQEIKADKKDSGQCLLMMLIEWLEGVVDPKPSWEVLEEGVRKINKEAVAQMIRDKYFP